MEYRQLGNTGLTVSAVGLGCATYAAATTDYAVALINRALDLGITYLDQARGYGDSEIKMGIALEGQRDRALISTKTNGVTRDDAWRDIESSLERLRTDYVDNLHMHNIHSWENLEARFGPGGALEALIEARDQGLTRHIGCTGHRNDLLIEALRRYPFETMLMVMNFVAREPLDELIPLCQAKGVGVTIMKGLSKGRLPTDLAIKWLLAQPVASVVPGALTIEEVEESAAVGNGDLTLTSDDLLRLDRSRSLTDKEACSVCGLCEPCPAGVGISGLLGTDGRLVTYRHWGHDRFAAYPWDPDRAASDLRGRERTIAAIEACTECGECQARCPRQLPIIELIHNALPDMRAIADVYRSIE